MTPLTAVARRVTWLLLLALSLAALSACRTEGETFIVETTLIGNATEGYGPYEVLVHTRGQRPITSGTLHWRTATIAERVVPLVALASGPDSMRGVIEAPEFSVDDARLQQVPFPLGTRVDYWVEVSAEDSAVAVAPFEAPDETFFFLVGPPNQPIRVDGVSPDRGPSIGGTAVFVHGEGFRPDTSVIFAGSVAPQVIYRSAHLLEVTTPPAPGGLAALLVRNPNGSFGRRPDAFYFVPSPTIASLEPDEGPTRGGTTVIVRGDGFEPGATVTLDGLPATARVDDRTTIIAISPAHEPGPVDVSITNPDSQTGGLAGAFTYVPAPRVTEVIPPAGPEVGGTTVEVLGEDLLAGASVFFDDQPADVLEVTPGRIRAVTPAHAAALVDVTVFNPDRQFDTGERLYTYLEPPELNRVEPGVGLTTGDEPVRLIGRGFFVGMTATFDGVPCADLEVVSPSAATCRTPPHPEGLIDVAIDVLGQRDTLVDGFLYVPPAPIIDEIRPDRGSDLGGTTVVIRVEFLQANPTVLIDGRPVRIVSVDLRAGTVTIVTDAHPEGPADVTVINADGQSDVAGDGFLFVGPPIIDTISPNRGGDVGGTQVTIQGRNFVEGMAVTLDGVAAEIVSIDAAAGVVVVRTPAHPLGPGVTEEPVDVQVTNPDGRFDIAENGFTYIVPPPEITRLEPPRGPTWGGNEVVIVGRNFRPGLVVLVNGVPVQARRVSATEVRFTMVAGTGTALVEVINPDDQSDSADYAFVVPTVAPSRGLTAGYTTVTLRGADFEPNMQVSFGGIDAVEVTWINATELRAITPPGQVGLQSLALRKANGLGGTTTGAFGYTIFENRTVQSGIAQERGCIDLDAVDIDGDGDVDFAVANGGLFQDNTRFVTNAIYLNQGGLTFSRREFGSAENSMNVDFADIDGDNDLDMFIVNLDSSGHLYENTGGGAFRDITARMPFSRDSYDGGFIDANHDGKADILFVNTSEPENLFINNGSGGFTDRTRNVPAIASEHDHDYAVGDLNGDGWDDFVIVVDNSIESNGRVRYAADHRIFMSNGDGTFTSVVDGWPLGRMNTDTLESQVADVNGDGLMDVVAVDNIDLSAPRIVPTTGFRRRSVMVMINRGGGELELVDNLVDIERVGPSFSFSLADVDNDGDLDLAVANFANVGDISPVRPRGQSNWLFVNRGNGEFIEANGSWPGDTDVTSDVVAGDFSGDGLQDLVICNYLSPNRMLVQTLTPGAP